MFPDMAWVEPPKDLVAVDLAGDTLVKVRRGGNVETKELRDAMDIISHWRSAHAFPLNTFQVRLRANVSNLSKDYIVAQRIKRFVSIRDKLQRFKTLKLSQIQDIGGCRAIVNSVREVNDLVDMFKQSHIKHKLIDEDDYIATPKKSGYRSHHLIYQYFSDKKDTYNGLKIEIQVRTKLQHAWATAVETVGTFIGQALKSSEGEQEWLRFFTLMSQYLAIREKTALVPNVSEEHSALFEELLEYANSLEVESRLQAFGQALKALEHPRAKNSHFFLLELSHKATRLSITAYKYAELDLANSQYLKAEKTISSQGGQAVLVSVDSLEKLKRAYPNYFLDTRAFLNQVRKALAQR